MIAILLVRTIYMNTVLHQCIHVTHVQYSMYSCLHVVGLHAPLPVCLCVCIYVRMYPTIYLSNYFCIYLFSICLCVCLCVCLYVCLSTSPTVYLSIYPHACKHAQGFLAMNILRQALADYSAAIALEPKLPGPRVWWSLQLWAGALSLGSNMPWYPQTLFQELESEALLVSTADFHVFCWRLLGHRLEREPA